MQDLKTRLQQLQSTNQKLQKKLDSAAAFDTAASVPSISASNKPTPLGCVVTWCSRSRPFNYSSLWFLAQKKNVLFIHKINNTHDFSPQFDLWEILIGKYSFRYSSSGKSGVC